MVGAAGRVAAERGDRAFVESLMHLVTEPGAMAGWIAPPKHGIHGRLLDYRCAEFNLGAGPCAPSGRRRLPSQRSPGTPRSFEKRAVLFYDGI